VADRIVTSIQMVHRGNIRRITINRPPLNLLDVPTLLALAAALATTAQHQQTRLVALMGAGDVAFSAGVDPEQLPERREALRSALMEVVRAFYALTARHISTVALLQGQALGTGCELALLCDTLIAREDTILGLPEITSDSVPPLAPALLPRLIGPRRALYLLLTGERISARTAYSMGLVHQVLPTATFAQEAEELLVMLAACGGQSQGP
jgi:enoyl-CoA hydratase/carnithine racemase